MFGPLPRLHRMLVLLTSLIVGALSGLWLVHETGNLALMTAGAGWGLLAGLLLTYVLLHDFHHRPQSVLVRRH